MFPLLEVWHDTAPRGPAGQMAVDETLFRTAENPVLRLYRWESPAVTFGYGQRSAGVLALAGARPAIRRWTGGGTVFHGSDLTLALAVPARCGWSEKSPALIYRTLHECLLGVLKEHFPRLRMAGADDCRPGALCFESPVLHDLVSDHAKICGGALRRSGGGFLYQGSLRWEEGDPESLAGPFARTGVPFEGGGRIARESAGCERDRYSDPGWNLKR